MAHAIWSGAINFGLVTIPVKLFTAVRADDLSFNMLHGKDEGRIKYERTCSVDGLPVPWDEIVKGYEYEKGSYVIITDEDFEKVNPDATQSVDIVEFVDLDTISPIYFDKPYYRARGDSHERIYRCGEADGRSAGARTDALG